MKSPRRFTLDDRGSSEGIWTRDGQAILFDSERNGRREIFRQGVLENIAETVVAEPGDVFGGEVSPDGAWLLYWESELTRVGGGAFPSSVRLMRRAIGGGSPEKLLDLPSTQAPQDGYYGFNCSTNPKGRSPCVLGLIEGKDYVFYSLDPTQGKGSRLGKIEITQPPRYVGWSLSPDGSRLALDDQDKYQGRIEVLTLSNGIWHDVFLETKEEILQSIAWAADGKSFFVSSRAPDSFNLLHVTPDGKVQSLLRKRS